MKNIFVCVRINLKKWRKNPRIYVLLSVMLVFGYWTLGEAITLSRESGLAATPWILPHFFAFPVMQTLFGMCAILLYCDAPFKDKHTAFVCIRTGKRNWILGQILYIAISSVIYTVCWFFISVLLFVPNIEWTTDWGTLFWSIADGGMRSDSLYIEGSLNRMYTGMEATVITLLLMWLVSMFLGNLILLGNLLKGKIIGLAVAGFYSFLAVFVSSYMMLMFAGSGGYYFSPVNWCCLYSLDITHTAQVPSVGYAISMLITLIVLMAGATVWIFCKKDMDLRAM